MDIITLDYESFYDSECSLSKLSPLEYINHPRFELQTVAVKFNDTYTDVLFGEGAIRHAFSRIDWSTKALLAHNNSGFDSYISAYRLGIKPKLWLDTMAMARPKHAKTTGLSLKALVEFYADELRAMGINPVKDNTVLVQTKGRRFEEFTEAEKAAMEVYNRDDTELCYGLFKILMRDFPQRELWQIDCLTRMRTEPGFDLDTALLETALTVERDRKRKVFMSLAKKLRPEDVDPDNPDWDIDWGDDDGVLTFVKEQLSSSAKFAKLLTSLGREVPMKPSPSNPANAIPALSKTDEAFIAMTEDEDELVAAAAQARLEVKSTLLETRVTKLLTAASHAGGKLPVPLRYCGADTTGRDSGEEYNCMTPGHEVLTPHGWEKIESWDPKTPVMQWWEDGTLNWSMKCGKVERPEEGEIVCFDAPFVRGQFTKDHRMVHIDRGVARVKTAGRVLETSGLDGVPAAGYYEGGANNDYDDAQLQALAACAADGTETRYHFKWGLRRQRKIDRLQAIFAACGIEPNRYVYGDTHIFTVVKSAHPWLFKGFGDWLLRLSHLQMDVFLAELKHWDGHETPEGHVFFYTSQRGRAEWVATIAHLRGIPARVAERAEGRFGVYFRGSITTSIGREHKRAMPYSGMVYCPTVESSFVLVRFNGAIHVTGNCQNLPAIRGAPKPSDAIRKSLRAPKGHKVGVADQSGIELRVNHFLWQVPSTMALYAEDPKADLYRAYAAERYGILPEDVDKAQRQLAKVAQLGLGFGAGGPTFRKVAKIMGGISLMDAEAVDVVVDWRGKYPEIVRGWRTCHEALSWIAAGQEYQVDDWGLVHTSKHGLHLPSGRIIRYPDLRQEAKEEDGRAEWVYAHGRHKARIYAGKVTENIVQALARDSIFDVALEFFRLTKLRPKLRVHDELVYLFPDSEAEQLLELLQSLLRTPPKWWPELIVSSEGDIGQTYGDAK